MIALGKWTIKKVHTNFPHVFLLEKGTVTPKFTATVVFSFESRTVGNRNLELPGHIEDRQ